MEDRYRYAFSEQPQRPNGPSARADYPTHQENIYYEDASNGLPHEGGNLSDLPNYRAANARTQPKYAFEVPSELNGGTVGESSHSFVHQHNNGG
jgi:hypothetical protein